MSYIENISAESLKKRLNIKSDADLKGVSHTDFAKFHKKRIKKTHPDLKNDALIMFRYPNKLAMKYPDLVDVYGYDGFNPPVVNKIPKYILPNTMINYKGKIYLGGKNGKPSAIQKEL